MRPPPLPRDLDPEPRHYTDEEMRQFFKPCPWCGEIERKDATGVYVIRHEYAKHPGFRARTNEQRREQ